jgi:hypothetical protein
VGGGHVDALIAAPLAAAMAIALARPRVTPARAMAVTLTLTAACLIKVSIVPVLALWLWWVVGSARPHRARTFTAHAAVIAASVAAALVPFVAGWHTLAPFTTLGGVEAWASPSQLVGRVARTIVGAAAGSGAGSDAAGIVHVAFLLLFVALLWRLARRTVAADANTLPDGWGIALLLLALTMPFLLPWYAAWFVPFLGLLADDVVLVAGALVTGVLALTLIPADPFHGYSTPGVMTGVHYGAASVLLLVLVVVGWRVLRPGPTPDDRHGATCTMPSQEPDVDPAAVR